MFFLWTASAMTGCARREEVFLEEMDSDEENSNRKAGEESTAYENNVAAGENPKKQSAVSDAGSEGNTENSALDLLPETPIPQKIFVDVCGAVVNPGVYELDEGARIFQAVDAAGGYLPEAAINYLNRARSIGDGQQIYVPTEKEVAENLELAMAKVPEALNDGDNSGNSGLEEIQGSSVENPSGTVGRDTGSCRTAFHFKRNRAVKGRSHCCIQRGAWRLCFYRRDYECRRYQRGYLFKDKRQDINWIREILK